MEITKEGIKNSLEYNWRKKQVKLYLALFLFASLIYLLVDLFVCGLNMEFIKISFFIWLALSIIFLIFISPFIIYNLYKMRYLINNYQKFKLYEVVLKDVCLSFTHRSAAYFEVNIDGKKVNTNSLFSNTGILCYLLEDYKNKRIIGLYDENNEIFYIINKV